MPTASEEQVPKPLTYTLMYHGLWCAMFLLSAVMLAGLFAVSGVGFPRSIVAVWPLLALALLAGAGLFIAYAIRLQVLLGEFAKAEAFQWSAASSWAVLALAPALWLGWVVLEPGVQQWLTGGHTWAPPEGIVSATYKVEVVVWWLSHLLSVRGIARGRKRYIVPAIRGDAAGATNGPTSGTSPAAGATLAPAGDLAR